MQKYNLLIHLWFQLLLLFRIKGKCYLKLILTLFLMSTEIIIINLEYEITIIENHFDEKDRTEINMKLD